MPTWDDRPEDNLIDDFDFTVTNAYFNVSEFDGGDKNVSLCLEGRTNNPDVPETKCFYSVGKVWETTDGGKTVHHTKGKEDVLPNPNSAFMKLVERCNNELGIADVLRARSNNPMEARLWVGLKFHMMREKLSEGSGDYASRPKPIPVAFLGEADGTSAPTGNGAASSPQTAAEKIAAARAAKANGAATSLRDQVKAVIASGGDIDAALAIPGVSEDDAILAELVDEGSALYTEARGVPVNA